MSVDQVFSHIKWAQWIKETLDVEITFPIVAANDQIAMKLGMLHPGKGTNTVRAVFIVDPDGKVRLIMYYPQEIGRNMDEIVRAVKALQLSDTQKIAVPAGWPDNEIIGDHVILPPPTDEKAAKERIKQADCFRLVVLATKNYNFFAQHLQKKRSCGRFFCVISDNQNRHSIRIKIPVL